MSNELNYFSANRLQVLLPWSELVDVLGKMFRGNCQMPLRHHHRVGHRHRGRLRRWRRAWALTPDVPLLAAHTALALGWRGRRSTALRVGSSRCQRLECRPRALIAPMPLDAARTARTLLGSGLRARSSSGWTRGRRTGGRP